MADYLIQQYISSNGDWIPLGGEGATTASAEVESLRREVGELRALIEGRRAD